MDKKSELPAFELPSTRGEKVGSRSYWQKRHLLLAMLPDADAEYGKNLVRNLTQQYARCRKLEAEILTVVGGEREKTEAMQRDLQPPFPVLFDADRSVYAKILGNEGRGESWLLVVDRFGSVWSRNRSSEEDDPAKLVEAALESLKFVNLQCPECGVPDVPPPA